MSATGARIKEARVNRQAAINRDGTSSAWMKRIIIDAVETASIPNGMVISGGMRGLSEGFSMISNPALIHGIHEWVYFPGRLICQITLPRMASRSIDPN